VRRSVLCGVVPLRRLSLRLIQEVSSAVVFSVTLAAVAPAQSPAEPDPHKRAVALSADVGSYPDDFTTRQGSTSACGSALGFGAGLSAIDRPRSALIVEGELRASMMAVAFACDVGLTTQPIPGGISPSGFKPASGTPVMPLVRTLVKVGLETPRDFPAVIIRGTIGGGMIWNANPVPVGSLTIGLSSNNPGTRFYAEFERDVSRVRELGTLYRFDSTGATPVGTATRVAHPTWMALRIGMEVPVKLP
jgi:hypothetical protein